MGKVFELKNSYIALAAGASHLMIDETTTPEAGIELGSGILSLNFGYTFAMEGANTHIGAEIVFKDLVLGYAYIPSDSLGGANRVTLTYKFANVTAKYFDANHDDVEENTSIKPRDEYIKPKRKTATLSDY
jgi:hypothetical protein